MAGPGRNEPCLCGSGKKFKHCCLTRPQATNGITPQDRTEAFTALLKYSRRDEFDGRVADAAREWADLPDATMAEAIENILEFPTSAEHTCACIRSAPCGRAWVFTVRDLWTKRDLDISERLGSRQLVKWDVLAARVHALADGSEQFDGAMMALPPAAVKPLLSELRAEHKIFIRWHPDATVADFFKESAPLIHDVWLEEVAFREPPSLITREGDPLTESTVVFDVPAAGDALARVLRQPDFSPGLIGAGAGRPHPTAGRA